MTESRHPMQPVELFYSYAHEDEALRDELEKHLSVLKRDNVITNWHDRRIELGTDWARRIDEHIDSAEIILLLVSANFLASDYCCGVEMKRAFERHRATKARVIPIILRPCEWAETELGALQVLPSGARPVTKWQDQDDALHDVAKGLRQIVAELRRGTAPPPPPPPPALELPCPYRGLEPFYAEHKDFFFGREELTARLLEKLRPAALSSTAKRFLAVIGPSGSGKSSLALAGLVPALLSGRLSDGVPWDVVICRPGDQPLKSLAARLTSLGNATRSVAAVNELAAELERNADSLDVFVRAALATEPQTRRAVIMIDQFEEVFALCQGAVARQAFIDNLLCAATARGGQAVVVLTMRADFYGKCALHPALAAGLSDHQLLVGPMTQEELQRAIEEPAHRAGCELETGLTERLIQDVERQSGALPLLQFALRELWEKRQGQLLTNAAYHAIGGLDGALEKRADAVLEAFTPAQRELCRQIFLRLTQPGEGTDDTKRRARMQELATGGDGGAAIEEVVRRLVDARLITAAADGDTRAEGGAIEVAHEALIRSWKELRQWIDADRTGLRTHHRLAEAAREWDGFARHPSYLYTGARLAVAREWASSHRPELSQLESEFLMTSRRQAGRQRLVRRLMAVAPLLILVTIAGAAWLVTDSISRQDRAERAALILTGLKQKAEDKSEEAENQRLLAQEQRKEADKQRIEAEKQRKVADKLREVAERERYVADINLAQQAFQENRLFQMRELLLRYETADHLKGFEWAYLRRLCGIKLVLGPLQKKAALLSAYSVAFSPDGRQIVSGGADGAVRIWDAATGKELRSMVGHTEGVPGVAFSPDGKKVASGSFDDTVRMWDASDGRQLLKLKEGGGGLARVAFSPDGSLLLSCGEDYSVLIRSAADGHVVHRFSGHKGHVAGLAFSPDGRRVASSGNDKTVKIWNLTTGKEERSLEGHTDLVYCVSFSPDGHFLASGDASSALILWEVATGSQTRTLAGHNRGIASVSFSADGQWLASASGDGTARLWDVAGGKVRMVLHGPGGPLTGTSFSADGTRLAIGAREGAPFVYDITAEEDAATWGWDAAGGQDQLAYSADGNLLAQGSDKGEIRLWDPATGREVRTIAAGTEGSRAVAFSSDSERVVAGSDGNSAKVFRVADGHELVSLRGHSASVLSVAFASRGGLIATGDKSGVVKVWNAETFQQVSSFTAHRSPVVDLTFSPDGTRLASAGRAEVSASYNSDDIIVWNPVSGERLRAWKGINPYAIAFSPDNHSVAISQSDGRVIVWDEAKEKEAFTFAGHNGGVMGLTFSPDGRQLISGGSDKTIRFWDMATGRPLLVLHGPRSAVTAVKFSPDGRRLAACERDRIHIWPSGEPAPASPVGPYRWVRWHREVVNEYESAKEWSAAAFHCTRLLEIDPNNSALYYRVRGNEYAQLNDWTRVVADAGRAIALDAASDSAWYQRGRAHFAMAKWDQASADYNEAVRLNPKNAITYNSRGLAWMQKKEYDKAIADYSESIRLDSKSAFAYANRGLAWKNKKEYEKAIADYNEAIRLDPKYAFAYDSRGDAWKNKKEYEKAIADYNQVLRLGPTDPAGYNSRGNLSLDMKEYDKAIGEYSEAIRVDPKYAVAYNNRGLAWRNKKDYDKAIADYNEAIRLDPKNAIAYDNRGNAWKAKKEYDKAIADYDEVLRLGPADPNGYNSRGNLWFDRKEYDKAIVEYSEAIRVDPKFAVGYRNRGLALKNKKEYDKAIADYNEAIRLDPEYADAYNDRGLAWKNKKEYDKAIADYNEAIRLDPKDAAAYDNRGDAWKAKSDYDKAIADYSEAIRVDPKYAVAYSDRGLARADKKEYDKALADYNEAIRLDPNYAQAYDNRGRAWSAKKEYDKAIPDYSEAIRVDPKYAIAYNDRGDAWRASKEYDKAIADHNEAIRIDPKNAYAYSARASAWMTKKQFDKAIADDSEAIRLGPKDAWPHLSRSVAQSLSRQREALRGFRETIDVAGWKSQWAAFAVIAGNLAARQFADPAAAKSFLDDSAGKLDLAWPYPIVRYLRGEIDERALLELAVENDKRTEARCYLGLDHAVEGRNDKAAAHLRWVLDHGNPAFIEYTIASAELDRLSKPATQPAPAAR